METTPGAGIILGFQHCAMMVGDDLDHIRNKFQNFVKKLDVSNGQSTRMKAVKEFDLFIQKRQMKMTKATAKSSQQKEATQYTQLPVYHPGMKKYEFPYCLSIIILKLKDLIFEHQNLKKEQKFDVENLIMRCLLHQRCLIYKMPNFILYFLDQVFPDTAVKLNYLQIVTHDSQEMDPAFNSQLFLILLKSIDFSTLRPPISVALSFVQGIFSNHPTTFNETQTMQMLLRITLAGIKSMSYQSDQPECSIGQEVFQILQHFLKYNEYSPKLFNICLFTMCILSNREQLSYPTFSVLNNLIMENQTFIFQEIVDILQIQSHLNFWDHLQHQKGGKDHQQQQVPQPTSLRKEIVFKCFKDQSLSSSLELTDLQEAFSRSNALLTGKQEDKQPIIKKSSLSELVCLNECFTKCIEYNQWTLIQDLEAQAQNKLKELIPLVINTLEGDKQQWILSMEKNFDRIQRGAIFFAGKSLWGQERIENLNFPINHVLKFYNQQIISSSKISLIQELVTSVKHLIQSRGNSLYYEWQHIISIMNSCVQHSDQIISKPKLQTYFNEIFSYIFQLIMTKSFPDFFEGEALKCYFDLKEKRVVNNKSLTQYALKFLMENYFFEYFERLRVACLINEKNQEIRTMYLDTLQDLYCEQVDQERCTLFEAKFTNDMEAFYVSRGEYALTTPQMIQIIDILAYIAHKTEKAANFKHVIEILQDCIKFYDYDTSKQGVQSANQFQTMVTEGMTRGHAQSVVRKEVISNIPHESRKMKAFQNHALNRMIQLFVLKGTDITESEKSVYLYNILLNILKVSYNDRKQIICNDFLNNLKVNSYRELCWLSHASPLFIEIQTKYNQHQFDLSARESCDSQGNSSGGSSEHASISGNGIQPRTIEQSNNAAVNRTSFDKLGQDKQLIQNTLKALVHAFEDTQTDSEIKKECLRQFHKFVAFVCDEDFNETIESQQMITHLKQNIFVDSKTEWIKIVMNLVHSFKPVEQPEYAILIIDIFYSVIALENNFKILQPQQVTHLVEKLIESLHLISVYLKQRRIEYEQQIILQRETFMKSGGKQGRETMSRGQGRIGGSSFVASDQREMQNMFGQGSNNSATTGNNVDTDDTPQPQSKPIICIIKKVISVIGFIFQISPAYGANFWNQNVIEGKAYLLSPDFQMHGAHSKPVVPQVKMIEYFIDQVIALIMNNQTMYKISHTVIICIKNITSAVSEDSNFIIQNPYLLDSLMFMIFRIITPFMQNNQQFVDPSVRLINSTYKLDKALKNLFSQYFSTLIYEEHARLYLKHYQKRSEPGVKDSLQKHLILDIISKLVRLRPIQQVEDSIIRPCLTLITKFDEELTLIKNQYSAINMAFNPEFLQQELKLRSFLDLIGQDLIWSSNTVYDRNCSTGFSTPSIQQQIASHYIFDNNLLSLVQVGSKVDIVVRNACFNYRAQIETQNLLQQSSSGSLKQISKIRNTLMHQAKGRQSEDIVNMSLPQNIQQIIQNDQTLMGLIDHSAHCERKWGKYMKHNLTETDKYFKSSKELICLPDEPKIRGWFKKALDKYSPKNIYCIEVTFVGRESKIDESSHDCLRNMGCSHDNKLEGHSSYSCVSENYLNFIAMLGTLINVTANGSSIKATNHGLYLKHMIQKSKERQAINLMINEDESNYIYYVPNVLNDSKDLLYLATSSPAPIQNKLHIIYNESNYEDFSSCDPTKIYLVFTKLNETQYLAKIQQARSGQTIPFYDSYFDYALNAVSAKQTELQILKEFKSGHPTSYGIVSQDKIGEWIKNMVVVCDAEDKNQRHIRNNNCVTSNMMQRALIIQRIKESFSKTLQKTNSSTVLKQ